MNLLLIAFVTQILKSRACEMKICYGGKADFLPIGCESVIGGPLIIEDFDYELTMNNDVGRKLSSIRKINSGLIIRRNSFYQFSAMRNLRSLTIDPKDGPVLTLEQNHNLMSVKFQNLRVINGSMPLFDFWQDNFPVQMRKSSAAFHQFLHLVTASGSDERDTCDGDYFDLHVMDLDYPIGNHIHYVVSGALGLLSLVIIIDSLYFAHFQRQWERRLDELEMEERRDEFEELLNEADRLEQWEEDRQAVEAEEKIRTARQFEGTTDDPNYAPGERERLEEFQKDRKKWKLEDEEEARELEKEEKEEARQKEDEEKKKKLAKSKEGKKEKSEKKKESKTDGNKKSEKKKKKKKKSKKEKKEERKSQKEKE
ncbi:unnamed protein product [Caenorhabditis sp. 36 PRJEB53466]|nr:unnamed protein product [Caenorhabditis sp. 36 PRJEB53466]